MHKTGSMQSLKPRKKWEESCEICVPPDALTGDTGAVRPRAHIPRLSCSLILLLLAGTGTHAVDDMASTGTVCVG